MNRVITRANRGNDGGGLPQESKNHIISYHIVGQNRLKLEQTSQARLKVHHHHHHHHHHDQQWLVSYTVFTRGDRCRNRSPRQSPRV